MYGCGTTIFFATTDSTTSPPSFSTPCSCFLLFYVYPLKFLFSVFLVNVWINPLIGMPNQITAVHSGLDPVTWGDVRGIFVIFGAGIAAIYFVFAAMFWHAYRLRENLRLSAFEIAYTKTSMVAQILNGGVGLLSILVASVFTLGHSGWAGYVYLVLLPSVALWRRRRRSLDERNPSPLALVPSGPAITATSEE